MLFHVKDVIWLRVEHKEALGRPAQITAGVMNTTLRLEGPHNFGRKVHRRCTANNQDAFFSLLSLARSDMGLTSCARAETVLTVYLMAEQQDGRLYTPSGMTGSDFCTRLGERDLRMLCYT